MFVLHILNKCVFCARYILCFIRGSTNINFLSLYRQCFVFRTCLKIIRVNRFFFKNQLILGIRLILRIRSQEARHQLYLHRQLFFFVYESNFAHVHSFVYHIIVIYKKKLLVLSRSIDHKNIIELRLLLTHSNHAEHL